MAELKTKQTDSSVTDFLDAISDEKRRKDCLTIHEVMQQATGSDAKMWGPSIVGYGERRIKYESGRELDWMVVGFSPRKQDLTLYLPGGLERYETHLQKLGKYKTGKGCLYIKKLEDIHLPVLKEILQESIHSVTKS